MEFRDLKRQYQYCKKDIDESIRQVVEAGNFISGKQVEELEKKLAEYVGRKYCISCGNGTDALQLALMAMGIGKGDAVFVPDFTFFSTGEVVSLLGATPVFVDIFEDTFNMNPDALQKAIEMVLEKGDLCPKVIVPVDLFGLPADYLRIIKIAERYQLKVLEDGAQGFGGNIDGRKACSFGDISTTSFFPAKPLGCYGDGGAVFTDNEDFAKLITSLRVHGKGVDKYDNVRIGLNSRLDTLQAAILLAKFDIFLEKELNQVNSLAEFYTENLNKVVKVPRIKEGFYSSWAQYSILLTNQKERDDLMVELKKQDIPSMIYYRKPMHKQTAFISKNSIAVDCFVTEDVCNRILALPMHPYMKPEEAKQIVTAINNFLQK